MTRRAKYTKQPRDIRAGAWVQFTGERYAKMNGTVHVVTDYIDQNNFNTESPDGVSGQVAVRLRDVLLLTQEEAEPYMAARLRRIEREDNARANMVPDVSGRSFFARRSRR